MNKTQAVLEIYAQREKLLHRLGRYEHNPDARKDLLQRTLVRIMSGKDKEIDEPLRYAYITARRLCGEDAKSHRDQVSLHSLIDNATDPHLHGAELLEFEEILNTLSRRLSKHNKKCIAVFGMHRILGYDYEEISEALHISPSMVKKYLFIANEEVSQMNAEMYNRAQVMWRYAREDRIKAQKALAAAEAEEQRRAFELADIMKGEINDGAGSDGAARSAGESEESAAHILEA